VSLCVHIHVCVYTRMYVCAGVCMYVCVGAWVCIRGYLCVLVCVCAGMCVRECGGMYVGERACMRVYTCICVYGVLYVNLCVYIPRVYACMYTRVYVCMCICMCVYMCECMYVCMYVLVGVCMCAWGCMDGHVCACRLSLGDRRLRTRTVGDRRMSSIAVHGHNRDDDWLARSTYWTLHGLGLDYLHVGFRLDTLG
jgi:hypothetical protein